MKTFRRILFVVCFGVSGGLASDFSLILGVDTRGTDSIYDSKYQSSEGDYKDVKRYGYEGYIGGRLGLQYFFTQRNAILGFVGLGYANIKLLNESDSFDLYSGLSTQVGLEYLLNYYSDEKFDFGFVAGAGYANAYYKRKDVNFIANEIFAILGLNLTIASKHRIELSAGIPIYSAGRYNTDTHKDIPVTRRFKNIYYGISYMYLFDL